MSIIMTLYLAGMPCALVVWMWTIWGMGDDGDAADTWTAFAAGAVFVALWPVFLFLAIKDAISER